MVLAPMVYIALVYIYRVYIVNMYGIYIYGICSPRKAVDLVHGGGIFFIYVKRKFLSFDTLPIEKPP